MLFWCEYNNKQLLLLRQPWIEMIYLNTKLLKLC